MFLEILIVAGGFCDAKSRGIDFVELVIRPIERVIIDHQSKKKRYIGLCRQGVVVGLSGRSTKAQSGGKHVVVVSGSLHGSSE